MNFCQNNTMHGGPKTEKDVTFQKKNKNILTDFLATLAMFSDDFRQFLNTHRKFSWFSKCFKKNFEPHRTDHNFHSTKLPHTSTSPYFFTIRFFRSGSQKCFEKKIKSWKSTLELKCGAVSWNENCWAVRWGSQKCLKKLKTMKKYGGAVRWDVRWAILWGGTVGRYVGRYEIKNVSCFLFFSFLLLSLFLPFFPF